MHNMREAYQLVTIVCAKSMEIAVFDHEEMD